MLINPRDKQNEWEHSYIQSLKPDHQNKLKYLSPLDGWFAMIIYPSLSVKNLAQEPDSEVRKEITRIKSDKKDHSNRVEGGNWPIEINLDACRNF